MKRHRWVIADGPNRACVHCGITMPEFQSLPAPVSTACTGNAYVCRVARKLLATNPSSECRVLPAGVGLVNGRWLYAGTPHDVVPWQLGNARFALFVWFCTVRNSHFGSDRLAALRRALADDPAVCPIYADALEEAGCADSALLDALRTP